MASLEQDTPKIKVYNVSDRRFGKETFRFVTKVAAQALAPKWLPSEDQTLPEELKKRAVAAVASEPDKNLLIEEYKTLAGQEPKEGWNSGRLQVEISRLKSKPPLAEQVETMQIPDPGPVESTKPLPKKSAKAKKS